MELQLTTFNRNEVLQYLRWTGSEIPPEIDALIDACMAQTLQVIAPRYTWVCRTIDRQARTPSLAFLGQDVPALLEDCSRVIFFAATLGNGLEMAIRQAQVRDLSRALVLDCCGSAAIEAVCDAAEREIFQALDAPDCYLTDRFSPGYGDLPVEVQPELLALLDGPRRIGLNLTASKILVPRKSVTALMGIADRPQTRRFRGCAYCSMFETCAFRKAGKTCGRQ